QINKDLFNDVYFEILNINFDQISLNTLISAFSFAAARPQRTLKLGPSLSTPPFCPSSQGFSSQ
ncbi:7952_t:CDS:1, partial [Scutellospora calospora]